VYGNKAISYAAWAGSVVKHSKFELLNATVGISEYIYLPQMYTTSLVHTSVVQEIKAKNKGRFYSSLTPDANGAANICSLEDKYLESRIPLAWVGSSPKSNGLVYGTDKEKFRKENSLNFDSNSIKWHPLAGFFNNGVNDRNIHNFKMYLFESILQTRHLQKPFWAKTYNSKIFKTALFARVYAQIKKASPKEVVFLREIIELNKVSFRAVLFFNFTISKLVWFTLYARDILIKIKNELFLKHIRLKQAHMPDSEIRLMDASKRIHELEAGKNFIRSFVNK
jgi:hypothetical protein